MKTYRVTAKIPYYPGSYSTHRRQCTVTASNEDEAWEAANRLWWFGLGIRVSVIEC